MDRLTIALEKRSIELEFKSATFKNKKRSDEFNLPCHKLFRSKRHKYNVASKRLFRRLKTNYTAFKQKKVKLKDTNFG